MMWWRLVFLFPFHSFLFLPGIIAFAAFPCEAQVVINEVYYDHPGRDEGWEFVEIFNAGEGAWDISGWKLESLDGVSMRAATLWTAPSGTRIEPKCIACISGVARNPAPAFLLKGSLGNGPDAVRLASLSGVVDLVGYGECTLDGLYESTPAPDVDPGFSLARKPDGRDADRNDADFVVALPTPGRRNFFSRDVGIEVAGEEILPCRGFPFSTTIKLVNWGLESFNGRVSIVTSAGIDGLIFSSSTNELDLALLPSSADSTRIAVAPVLGSRFEVRATILDAPDENPSNDTVRVFLGSSPGEIVINEIMYRPCEGMSEWVELKNNSTEERNLELWTICDATGSKRIIANEKFSITAGGFVILAKDSALFEKEHPGCRAPVRKPAGGWPSLNDTDKGSFADMVELHDSVGVLRERVFYRDLLGNERGRSIERISPEVCSALAGGIWHRCAARSGSTPGAENSTRMTKIKEKGGVSIFPNPFCPGRNRETVITAALGEGETGFLVRIFDLGGFELRRIFGENGGARAFSCRWDGRANGGSPVRTGLYVCLVEFVGTGGGVCRKEKKCIAVAEE